MTVERLTPCLLHACFLMKTWLTLTEPPSKLPLLGVNALESFHYNSKCYLATGSRDGGVRLYDTGTILAPGGHYSAVSQISLTETLKKCTETTFKNRKIILSTLNIHCSRFRWVLVWTMMVG